MYGYQPPQYQQSLRQAPQQRSQMGAVSSLGVTDWLLMGGGAIVAGVGLNTIYTGVTKTKKPNFVSLLVGGILTLVGGTLTVQEIQKVTA